MIESGSGAVFDGVLRGGLSEKIAFLLKFEMKPAKPRARERAHIPVDHCEAGAAQRARGRGEAGLER